MVTRYEIACKADIRRKQGEFSVLTGKMRAREEGEENSSPLAHPSRYRL